jgi:hypothetical protein
MMDLVVRFQAPAILGGGGTRRSFGAARRAAALAAGRKNTHAVTTKPKALASAVRRSVLSWAKSVTKRDDSQLSNHGEKITSRINPAAVARHSRYRIRGNQDFVIGHLSLAIAHLIR